MLFTSENLDKVLIKISCLQIIPLSGLPWLMCQHEIMVHGPVSAKLTLYSISLVYLHVYSTLSNIAVL